jgi:hypothetical protein
MKHGHRNLMSPSDQMSGLIVQVEADRQSA